MYVADPLLALLIVPLAGLWPPRPGPPALADAAAVGRGSSFRSPCSRPVVGPQAAAAYWPWALPPVAGQLYACFILTFAIGAVLAARETDARAIRDFLIASLSLCVLVLLASVLHLDRFQPAPISAAWFALVWMWRAGLRLGRGERRSAPAQVGSAARTWTEPSAGRLELVDPVRLLRLYIWVLGRGPSPGWGRLLLVDWLGVPVPVNATDWRHNLLHVVWGIALLVVSALAKDGARFAWRGQRSFRRLLLVLGVLGLTSTSHLVCSSGRARTRFTSWLVPSR